MRLLAVGLSVLAATVVVDIPGQAAQGAIRSAGGKTAVADSYIVVLKEGTAVAEQAQRLASEHGGTVVRVFETALHGFATNLTEPEARNLAVDPAVDYVEQNHTVSATDTQTNPSWSLDRVDQAALPLSKGYTFPNTGVGVHAYILDSGIRTTHQQFGGRAVHGYDAVDGTRTDDCNGHGTHVAGILGGASYGVAKGVELVSVRVLDCSANGTFADLIAGIDWVTAHAAKPAVANVSISGVTNSSVNAAVASSIASGVTYSVAASNQDDDACTRSPASVPEAITVGATENNDARAPYSNYGACLDLFAPGTDIVSAGQAGDTATATRSGTSMAAPHVAGAAALLLSQHPDWSPAQVRDSLVAGATTGAVTNAGDGSPNLLLRVENAAAAAPPPQLMPFSVPKEVLDTRDGTGGVTGKRGPATTTTFPVLGIQHIPSTGVQAVVVRITAHAPTATTYLTVWPDGTTRPAPSTVNTAAGDTISNITVVTPGANGRLAVYNHAGDTNIIVDVQGYFTTTTGRAGGGYRPVDHTRVADTRSGLGTTTGQIPSGGSRTVDISGAATGAPGAFVNLIVPGATADGWVNGPTADKTVMNYTTGSTQSGALLRLPANGRVTFYNRGSKPIDLVVIAEGFITPNATPNTGFRPVVKRLLDTRSAGTGQPVAAGATIDVQVAGTAGIPATGAAGVVIGLIAKSEKPGYLMAWQAGGSQPSVTVMDFNAADMRANTIVLTPGDDGKIRIKNGSSGPTHLLVDVQGWFGIP